MTAIIISWKNCVKRKQLAPTWWIPFSWGGGYKHNFLQFVFFFIMFQNFAKILVTYLDATFMFEMYHRCLASLTPKTYKGDAKDPREAF